MCASADAARSCRSAATLPVTNRQRSSAPAARTACSPPATTSRRVKSTMRGTGTAPSTSVSVGMRTSPSPRAATAARSTSPTEASSPQRRSSVWSCRTTMAPSRVQRRSISTMSAPRATAAAKAGNVFSRWPTGSPRWAMAIDAHAAGGRLGVAGVDGARHVGDDLVERRLNQVVHTGRGDVHSVRAAGEDAVHHR